MRTVCGLQQDERILLVDLVVAVKVIDIDYALDANVTLLPSAENVTFASSA